MRIFNRMLLPIDKIILISLAIIFFFSLFSFLSVAQTNLTVNSTQYCIDDRVLRVETDRLICIEGECDNVERIWNHECEWGCDQRRQECFADPLTRFWWILLIVVGFIVIVVLIRRWV